MAEGVSTVFECGHLECEMKQLLCAVYCVVLADGSVTHLRLNMDSEGTEEAKHKPDKPVKTESRNQNERVVKVETKI